MFRSLHIPLHMHVAFYNKYLDMLKERVFYFDTDSILFLSKEGDEMPKTGDYLGDMTDELEKYGPNAYISEFAAGGPKNYAYKIKMNNENNEEKTVCKVKGIRLNYMNSQIINFETIKNLLLNYSLEEEERNKIEIKNKVILRENNNIVYTYVKSFNYRINVTKRRRLRDDIFKTLPYGHV